MSVAYRAVQWNRHKILYDIILVAGVLLYVTTFLLVSRLTLRDRAAPAMEVLLMRALGTCAFVMLQIILSIGPLARLSPRFNPILYNRRHFGVTLFCVALAHGLIALGYYHGFGNVNPFLSLLTNGGSYASFAQFPFQILGAVALMILFLMAATSHDFWLKNLTPPVWKSLHMLVYVAYGLLVLHMVLGALQSERSPILAVLVIAGIVTVSVLHLIAGMGEVKRPTYTKSEKWIDVGHVHEIPENRAKKVCMPSQERIAIYRYEGKISAVTDVCAHQNGPLSEGKIVNGCITCPWHGYQYLPESGTSPPPFTEKIPTFRVRVTGGRILLNPTPLPPGTAVTPADVEDDEGRSE